MISTSQSRAAPLLEALTNVAVGYVLAIAAQHMVFSLFGFQASMVQHGAIAAVFTLISLCRSYVLRRLFAHAEAMRRRDSERRARRLNLRLEGSGGAGPVQQRWISS